MMFKDLNEDSKVWIYTADRFLNDTETKHLLDESQSFVKQWAAHGVGLKASADVLNNRFLILAVDETQANASGCSIDSSVKFVKAIGSELNVDFFQRMKVILEQNGELKEVHFSDLKEHKNWKIYNPMVSSLKDLRSNWLIPVSESPFL